MFEENTANARERFTSNKVTLVTFGQTTHPPPLGHLQRLPIEFTFPIYHNIGV